MCGKIQVLEQTGIKDEDFDNLPSSLFFLSLSVFNKVVNYTSKRLRFETVSTTMPRRRAADSLKTEDAVACRAQDSTRYSGTNTGSGRGELPQRRSPLSV